MTHHTNHLRGSSMGGGGFGRMAALVGIGALAGLAAGQARKVAMQGPSIASGDWMEALKTEHRMVEKLFETLLATDESQTTKRNAVLGKIAYALSKHAVQEENVIYPALKEAQPGGDSAGGLVHDHADIKTFIFELKRMEASDPRWIVRAREFQQLIERHVREEEDQIFPALASSLSSEENGKLTAMMNWEGYKVA
jgi:hemerythrin superfamily protein